MNVTAGGGAVPKVKTLFIFFRADLKRLTSYLNVEKLL